MKINPGIFKAYDIRGIYNEDFNDDMAYRLGLAYAKMRRKELENKKKIKIVVGGDMRVSTSALKERLIEGLLDGGCDVVDIGLASTPTYYFAVANYGYDGGLLVSASHNPKEYNGFKIVRDKAIPISGETGMMDLRDLVIDGIEPEGDERGELTKNGEVLQAQIKHDLNFVKKEDIKKLKIVIDTANAMGAQYFEELFKELPQIEVVKMNWELDGTFPAHEADPFKFENVEDLSKRVVEEKADLGISTDGDGDRIFFIDNLGVPVEPGITRAIMCKIFLRENPGAKICYDIRPGKITEDVIRENGGVPIVTRVGHSLIKEQTIKEGAVFAGESSGHFFLNLEMGCFEVPMIVTLELLKELTKADVPFSDYIKPYNKYFNSREINTKVGDPDAIIKEIKEKYSNGKQSEIDGITIYFDDYWFNVRKSNTEPLLRLTVEATTKEKMEDKRDELLEIIKK